MRTRTAPAAAARRSRSESLALSAAYRHLVFDLDGTLVDSAADLAAAVNAGLAVFERPPLSRDVIIGFVGNGTRKLVEGSLRAAGLAATEETVDRAYEVFRSHYDAHLLDETRLYPGVEDLLGALAANGVVLSVLTNKVQRASERILAGLGIAGRFRAIRGGDDEATRKPNPAGLLRLVAEAAIEPAETLLVGDSDVDVATARAAGVPFCGVAWGFRSPERIRAAGATWLVEHPEEILAACVDRV